MGELPPSIPFSEHAVLEFEQVVSDARNADGELRSLFTKGYTYRRHGVPELLRIMHRSQFVDMSSRLSAASRGTWGTRRMNSS